MFDGLSLDPFSLFDDGFGPAEAGIGGRHIVQALVIALVIVMLDERLDLAFEVTGQEVVLDGYLPIPQKPGLGVTVNEAAVREAHQQRHRWRNPVWRLSDGNFAEW